MDAERDADRIRNLGIVAHIDAGKTTVSERILFYAGVERRMGEVHEGSAVMDWMDEERKRGITITSAATTVPWREHAINLIDTPGHVDFTVEVERCMRVLDGAVLVVNGVAGVQAQSETVWRQMGRHGVRALAFVNQLDRPGADFSRAVQDLRERLDCPAIPIQYPIGSERGFRAIVDLLRHEALEFPEETLGKAPRPIPVPSELADEVGVLRSELLESLAEEDEELLEVFLSGTDPPLSLLQRVLRARVCSGSLVPVLCGSALRNVGIQPLLDAVVDYLPSPRDVPPVEGVHAKTGETLQRPAESEAPTCALAFKLQADPNEDLLFARVYSGKIRPGSKLFNARVGRMERVARVLRIHSDARQPLEEVGPGDIVGLTGTKFTVTGDTLGEHDEPIFLERLEFPDPVIAQVIEPRATGDRDKLRDALQRLAFEDPSLRVREDEDTGQWLVSGMGELHLEIKVHRLEQEFRLEVNIGQPRVAYREAPTRTARGSARVDRTLGGTRVFGGIDLEVRPRLHEAGCEPGSSAEPTDAPTTLSWEPDCVVPEKWRRAVEEGLLLEAQVGPRFGFPLVGAHLALKGGESHPERDSELGFTQAASQALRQALGRGGSGAARACDGLRDRGSGRFHERDSGGAQRQEGGHRRAPSGGRLEARHGPRAALRHVRLRHDAALTLPGESELLASTRRLPRRPRGRTGRPWPGLELKPCRGRSAALGRRSVNRLPSSRRGRAPRSLEARCERRRGGSARLRALPIFPPGRR